MSKMMPIAIIATLFLPYQAVAQPVCAERDAVLAMLAEQFDERPVAMGLSKNGSVVEVLASEKTWTVIMTAPTGVSCLVGIGEGWQTLPVKRGSGS